jgi:hypothetical protein
VRQDEEDRRHHRKEDQEGERVEKQVLVFGLDGNLTAAKSRVIIIS